MTINKVRLDQIVRWWSGEQKAPPWASDVVDEGIYQMWKERESHPVAESVEALHPYVQQYIGIFKEFFPTPGDLHMTGSWVTGAWCHHDYSEAEHLEIRRKMNKAIPSDFDFWTLVTEERAAIEKLRKISAIIDIKCDWVGWWGPAIPIHGGPLRACNKENAFGAKWQRRYGELRDAA